MKLSVIVPMYDHLSKVLRCLRTLRDTASREVDVEYLVQDDAGERNDGRREISRLLASVERNPENLGFSGCCNRGAARAGGDVLFFVNQDIYAHEDLSAGWDQTLARHFEERQRCVIGALLLFPNGSIQSAGGLFDGARQPFHRFLGFGDHRHEAVQRGGPIAWVTGAALAVDRAGFDGFDEGYIGGYFEDVDLCLRHRSAGAEVEYHPQLVLIHEAGSCGGNPCFLKNAERFRRKWHEKIVPDVRFVVERFWA